MGPIDAPAVDAALKSYVDQTVFLHLETTNGAYAAVNPEQNGGMAVCAYIRNVPVRFHRAGLTGTGPYRAGLQMEGGWIYAEGLTDWEVDDQGRLLLAGHDDQGRLAVALELSRTPFAV